MDVSTCSPFGCNRYATFRSHVMGFEEGYPTGKTGDVLLRKNTCTTQPKPRLLEY